MEDRINLDNYSDQSLQYTPQPYSIHPPSLSYDPDPSFQHQLSQIREESVASDGSIISGRQGHVNPNFSYSLDASFTSQPSAIGSLTPAFSQTSVASSTGSSRCVIKRGDGSTILVTPDRESRSVPGRPLTETKVKILKIVSIISVFLFPPTGIAAVVYAILTQREFMASKYSGDNKIARKNAKYCEILNIVSLVCGLLMYTLIFALIGRNVSQGGGDVGVV